MGYMFVKSRLKSCQGHSWSQMGLGIHLADRSMGYITMTGLHMGFSEHDV